MSEPQAPQSLILGTAGHIDHGKSSLIKAMTGVDPDRLAEEKRRGITIELGFAQLDLPSGRQMGVVDVPGHEKFVRQMVAGATGVDVALLVIAADDGVMPQTIEHMAVLELLGVSTAVVALTKVDLVDHEWTGFVESDIRAKLAGTPFANAPIIRVSSRTGEGVDDLREAIDKAVQQADRTKGEGFVRMPIDRVFTVRGIGTVVTGTLWSGVVKVDDALVVLPSGRKTRVRSVQMHGNPADEARSGNRVALSLAQLSVDEVRPGDFLCSPDAAETSDRFDAKFAYMDPFAFGKPLVSGVRVHVAHGTREVLGRILLMDEASELASGETAFVQVRLEEKLPLAYGDRFVVRSYSPTHVIGGGEVLLPHPRRRTNLKQEEREILEALGAGDDKAAIEAYMKIAKFPETAADVAFSTGLDEQTAMSILDRMAKEGSATIVGNAVDPNSLYARPALVQHLVALMDRTLLEFHNADANAVGMSKEALREKAMPNVAPSVFEAVLADAADKGAVVLDSGLASHPKAGAGAKQQMTQAESAIEKALLDADGTPPDLPDVAKRLNLDMGVARKAAVALEHAGRIVRVVDDRYYHSNVIDRYKDAIARTINEQGPSTAADLKEAMETSRKYAMPLLEYFDAKGFTRRDGDFRVLVKG